MPDPDHDDEDLTTVRDLLADPRPQRPRRA